LKSLILAPLFALGFAVSPATAQSLEQMAGQMIVMGFQGDGAGDVSVRAVAGMIERSEIGGVLYLRGNVASLRAVGEMNALFAAAAPDAALPPLIALDQEGGQVERLTRDVGFEELPSAERIAAGNSTAQAEAIYAGLAERLAALGFNVNFGPVVDVNTNPDNPIIARYGRAFSPDPDAVSRYAAAFIDAHHRAGLLTALKHFPGHGSSTGDSHEGFVDITDTWSESELEPFRALIAAGEADMVMTGHLVRRSSGDGELPASLSVAAIDGELRGRLGFEGVVVSDDMEMGAIKDHFSRAEAVLAAVRAGTDILLSSAAADPEIGPAGEIRAILVAEAGRDPAFRVRIEESYARILALKARLAGL
jgi:beta-N-acetylhexosaminidase